MTKKSKFKKRKGDLSKILLIPVKPNKQVKKAKLKIISQDYFLNPSESDLIHYAYETDHDGTCRKVIDVSYSVMIEGKWYPVVRFDSEHDYLHRHMRISKNDSREIRSRAGVKTKGDPHDWLSWARKEISRTYLDYRVGFFRRSKIKDLY